MAAHFCFAFPPEAGPLELLGLHRDLGRSFAFPPEAGPLELACLKGLRVMNLGPVKTLRGKA